MLAEFDFLVIQLRHLSRAMSLIPSFRPPGLTPAVVDALVASTLTPRGDYITKKTLLVGEQVDRRGSMADLHKACVDFHAQARNTFRADRNLMGRLERLPTQDQSFQDTLARADAVLALWALLPLVGTPPAAFTVAQRTTTLTAAALLALRTAAGTDTADVTVVDTNFQEAEGVLHKKQAEMDAAMVTALAHGKSQFEEGSGVEREIIDSIPTEGPRHLPGKAVITGSTSPGSGVASVTYECDGATSFDILQREEGAGPFILVGDDVLAKSFEVTALSPGPHEFVVRGRNARGMGEESDITVVEVQV